MRNIKIKMVRKLWHRISAFVNKLLSMIRLSLDSPAKIRKTVAVRNTEK